MDTKIKDARPWAKHDPQSDKLNSEHPWLSERTCNTCTVRRGVTCEHMTVSSSNGRTQLCGFGLV